MHRLSLVPLVLLVLLCSGCAGMRPATPVERHFASIASSPPELRAFLSRMPKGADLHSHLSGAVYAETYLEWATEDGYCLNTKTGGLAEPPCSGDTVDAAQGIWNPALRAKALQGLSMYGYSRSQGVGRDRFFATFSLYSPASHNPARKGAMVAEAADRAAAQNIQHLELMLTPVGSAARALGRKAGLEGGFAAARDRLLRLGVTELAQKAIRLFDTMEHQKREALACTGDTPHPGCDVSVRYICQVTRLKKPEEVFGQIILAHELIKRDPRVVSLTLVAPEDHPRSLADYSLHMRMLGFLASLPHAPPVHLHAGELAMGLVRPKDLRFHVTEAVDVARARRIGHGVDVMYEQDAEKLLEHMAEGRIPVEIMLTSNAQVLGVTGPDHPLRTYLTHGVPVVLATDDEGVERTDLTNEYQRAVLEHDLTYADLKRIARNALEFSFLPGQSLWEKPYARMAEPCAHSQKTTACQDFLKSSAKAEQQWRLEERFKVFEDEYTTK